MASCHSRTGAASAPLSPALERVLHTNVCSALCGHFLSNHPALLMLVHAHTSKAIGRGGRMILPLSSRAAEVSPEPIKISTKRGNDKLLQNASCNHLRSAPSRMKRKISPVIHTKSLHPHSSSHVSPDPNSTAPQRKFSVVSMFSGCGGMDFGFRGGFTVFGHEYDLLPFEVIWANEHNTAACRTYKKNLGVEIKCEDVWTAIDSIPQQADVLIGGFPCQDVSVNGKREGLSGKRTGLYKAMIEGINTSSSTDRFRTCGHPERYHGFFPRFQRNAPDIPIRCEVERWSFLYEYPILHIRFITMAAKWFSLAVHAAFLSRTPARSICGSNKRCIGEDPRAWLSAIDFTHDLRRASSLKVPVALLTAKKRSSLVRSNSSDKIFGTLK